MYVLINVVKRIGVEIVVYRCFQRMFDSSYFVQSADRLRLPLRAADVQEHESQFWQLLVEADPESRSEPAPTLEEAIRRFDAYFAVATKLPHAEPKKADE